mmetsp:Transcript_1944/g.4142  ORF Transcript_1944/g.4142 Transcript_1944/m.4142 type:complete len:87 (-) Transcript_1944:211-471(-)
MPEHTAVAAASLIVAHAGTASHDGMADTAVIDIIGRMERRAAGWRSARAATMRMVLFKVLGELRWRPESWGADVPREGGACGICGL